MSTKRNESDEVWNSRFKLSFRCRCRLGCANDSQQNQTAQTLQVLSMQWQNNYQLNPLLEPKRGNSITEKVWIVYSKDYSLDFRWPLGSLSEESVRGKSAGLFPEQRLVIEPTKIIDVFI